MDNKIRSRFNPPPVKGVEVKGESLTQQQFAKDADINSLVSRHMRGSGRMGMPLGNPNATRKPIFGDFTSIDYHRMLNTVAEVDNVFNRLPARVRNRFRNNPELLIKFTEDPANLKEAVKMGLIKLPEGQAMTEEGNIVEQTDLEAAAKTAAGNTPGDSTPQAPRADPEANSHNGPKTGGVK